MTRTIFTSAALLAALVLLPLDTFAQRGGGGRGGGNMGGGRGNGGGISIGGGGVNVGGGSSFRGGANVGPSRADVNIGAGTSTGVRAGGARVGGSGFGIGIGPGGIYAGPTRGWYGGRYGSYGGYPYGRYGYGYSDGWGRDYGYGGYYSGNTYYSSPTYSQSVVVRNDYDGPGVAIRNLTDQSIHFTLDDQRQLSIGPQETIRLTEAPQFLIAFDRGSSFGSTRYTIHEGLYEFTPTERGWELFRQKADNVSVRPNDAVPHHEHATPRTAERPRFEPLPESRPTAEGAFDGEFRRSDRDLDRRELPDAEFRDTDGDLREPDLRDRDMPPPVPEPDNPADDY
jgi:hypothetical protein